MQKKHLSILCLAAFLLFALAASLWADDSEFRLIVTKNSGAVGARFHVNLEMRAPTTRTLNSLTIDLTYGPELTAFATNPDSNWFSATTGYDLSVSKLTSPVNYYRVLVTGNGIGKSGAGTPPGFNVTTTWQRVVTLRWSIGTLSPSYNVAFVTTTDAAAYFDNLANNPEGDLTEWATDTKAGAALKIATRVFLHGPYSTTTHSMTTALNPAYIPLTSPYSWDPRTIGAIPADVTDWVLLQLRSSTTGATIAARSLFLHKDGYLVADNGTTTEHTISSLEGVKDYYLVIRHRNHLAVMSQSGVTLNTTSPPATYDFTTALNKHYGGDARLLEAGVYGMYAGDANGNGMVQTTDKNVDWRTDVGKTGYYGADMNLNSMVQTTDKNSYWRLTVGKNSQVP